MFSDKNAELCTYYFYFDVIFRQMIKNLFSLIDVLLLVALYPFQTTSHKNVIDIQKHIYMCVIFNHSNNISLSLKHPSGATKHGIIRVQLQHGVTYFSAYV